jgi:hypothetical protein
MHPDRQIVLGHPPENRPELGRAERLATDVREQLNASRVKDGNRAVHLFDARIDIVCRECGYERWKCMWIFSANVRKAVVGDSRQFGRNGGRPDQLQRGIRK